MCSTNRWPAEGVSDPSPSSFEDLIFCWRLFGLFPEFCVADALRPSDTKDY